MSAENMDNNGCSQRDSAEHEGYAKAHRSFNSIWKERNSAQPELLEKILYKDNLNRAIPVAICRKCGNRLRAVFIRIDSISRTR